MQLMTTSPLVKHYTLEEFWTLPDPKDGSKLELIAGVLYMSPPPNASHNYSSAALNKFFILHLAQAGEMGIIFTPRAALWTNPATYVEPDLFYLSSRTLKLIDPDKPDTADLVIEIISPGTAIYDRNTKADTYAAMGVRELWLVDPDNNIVEVRNLKRGTRQYGAGRIFRQAELIESKILPGFSPSVADICNAVPHKTK